MTKTMQISFDIQMEPSDVKFLKGVRNDIGGIHCVEFDFNDDADMEIITGEQYLDLDEEEQKLYTLVRKDYLFINSCIDNMHWTFDRKYLEDWEAEEWDRFKLC